MMRALWTIFGIVWLALVAISEGSPLVVGFERFHAVEDAGSVQGGRLLFNELGCINCHGGVTGLPERGSPHIQGVIRRANVSWIRTFLEMPHAAHAGSTMPAMFSGRPAADREAVIQYLASWKCHLTDAPFACMSGGCAPFTFTNCMQTVCVRQRGTRWIFRGPTTL